MLPRPWRESLAAREATIATTVGGHDSRGDDDGSSNDGSTAETTDDERTGANDVDVDVDPLELDIDPDEGWGTAHTDVTVPDEPGQAYLEIGGETYELFFSGVAGEIRPPGDSHRPPTFFEFDTAGVHDDLAVQSFRRRLGVQLGSQTYRVFEVMTLAGPEATPLGEVRYGLLADGSRSDGRGIGETTHMDESFVRVDRSGVVTATGTFVTDDRGVDAGYSLDGPFALGARFADGWNAEFDGGE
ncbi:hypothetical protein ACLI4Y_00160 [Natrialbaceae archaeon A-CW3]